MTFARPTLQELRDRASGDVALALGLPPLLPTGNLRVLADAFSALTHGLHGHQAWTALQIVPQTAATEHLELWADLKGLARKPAAFASGTVAATGAEGSTIAAGTLWRRTDGAEFAVTTAATIGSGGTVNLTVQASASGTGGNTPASTTLTLASPVQGFNSSGTVGTGGLSGGKAAETDAELLERVLLEFQEGSTVGTESGYEADALTVAGVTRAFAVPHHDGVGTVAVFVLSDGGGADPIPTPTLVAEVQAVLDDPARRQVAATVTARAPVARPLNPSIQLIGADTAEIRANVEASLIEALRASSEPGGTFYLTWIHEAISLAEGEVAHDLIGPTADVVAAAGEIHTLGTITWSPTEPPA